MWSVSTVTNSSTCGGLIYTVVFVQISGFPPVFSLTDEVTQVSSRLSDIYDWLSLVPSTAVRSFHSVRVVCKKPSTNNPLHLRMSIGAWIVSCTSSRHVRVVGDSLHPSCRPSTSEVFSTETQEIPSDVSKTPTVYSGPCTVTSSLTGRLSCIPLLPHRDYVTTGVILPRGRVTDVSDTSFCPSSFRPQDFLTCLGHHT